jgi:hypothetical protein
MHIDDLVRTYEKKSDEELMQLAAAREQLTSDAQLALQSELSRRRLHFAEERGASQSEEIRAHSERVRAEGRRREGVTDFLTEVLRTHHRRFWLLFRITLPAVIISTTAILLARHENREIARELPRHVEVLVYRPAVLEMWLVNYSAYLVSWIASSFAFGAICIAIEEAQSGFIPLAGHSFWNIRERLGPFLRASLLLYLLLSAIGAGFTMLMGGVYWVLPHIHLRLNHLTNLAMAYAFEGLALLVFSRFALTIPAVLLDDYKAGQAIFRSDRLTGERWLTVVVLLAKSIIEGYVAAMSPFWLAPLILGSAQVPSWFHWVLTGASVIGVAAAESGMFAGLVLLYLKTSATNGEASGVLSTALPEPVH